LAIKVSKKRNTTRARHPLPLPVKRAKLGEDIRSARLRRRISTSIMAARAFIRRTTLFKVERGDPGVSLGTYATVLFVLGLISKLENSGRVADKAAKARLLNTMPPGSSTLHALRWKISTTRLRVAGYLEQ
jgi:hypothetical protein